ncbi:serine/threonine protein kinase [Lithohypha guttulata]|nr:serine/threonine protein kinase [Lithohypha guttulata]
MNDLSLGRLRIANPDESSPETPLQPQTSAHSIPPLSAVSPLPSIDSPEHDYIGIPPRNNDRSVSPASDQQRPQNNYNAPLHNETTLQSQYNSSPPLKSDELPQRQKNLPLTYQDQQQAQFPQYPTMMPQNLHDPRQGSSRPGSMYYTSLPVSNNGNGLSRQTSYRAPGASGTNTPQRSVSRRNPQPQYAERDFRPSPQAGSLPQRTTSRHMQSSRYGSTPTHPTPLSSTPASQTALSVSPYGMEGGPLSSAEDWQEKGAAVGVRRDYDVNGQPVLRPIKKGVKDFNFGATLGEGSYSTVMAAQDRETQKEYAIKVLDKRHIIKEKKVKYVNIEKETLNRLTDHPGVVRLYYTFQDERSLYFVLDLCSGGELLSVLKRMTTFDEECTRFYGAQILDTISYMHQKGVIHRDLKPENVLMDENQHIKITDFGTAKMLEAHQDSSGRIYYDSDTGHIRDRASSFVGTAEYVSPELLTDKNACKASDLWAFGCIIYQLLAGRPPFKAANEYLTFQKIVALEYEFPHGFPDVARDLVERLLVLDPLQRLSLENIKNHEFFRGIRWGRGLWQERAPKLKPYAPPPRPPIKLNGSETGDSYTAGGPGHSTQSTMMPPTNGAKPSKPRVITELPPPSQLDIEWSPVLTKSNERILKLGNLNVNMTQGPNSPGHDGGNKLSRFFGGNTTKKRQRLVMVTSGARIIIAAAGGDEKKSKSEIDLLAAGTDVVSSTDLKGTTHWTVSTRDKRYTFEDVKPSPSDTNTTAVSTREWLDAVDRARDFANAQSLLRNIPADESLTPGVLSHASTFEEQDEFETSPPSQSHRGVLSKQPINTGDNESLKGRKRFSKRQSKSGLTAVF